MTPELKIGVAGLGTVGAGVVQLLQENQQLITDRCGKHLRVTAVSARSKVKDRGFSMEAVRWVDDPILLAVMDDVDIVVELIGGSEGVARLLVENALAAERPVVTANKALLAHHGRKLAELAENHGVPLAYEAAVAGGIPVIKVLREGLAANHINRVTGILNGTCNYILTTMEKSGRDFADVLQEAQEKGYAEADPSFDIDGLDAAHKLSILAGLAFGFSPDLTTLHVEGITAITAHDIQYARELGHAIKLLGVTAVRDGKIEQRVHPCMIPHDAPLATVDGVYNAIQVEGDRVGRLFLEGRGAGAGPTASSVVADLIDIARGTYIPPLNMTMQRIREPQFSAIEDVESCYYLRLTVYDRPGVLADVANVFRDAGISVRSLIQHESKPEAPVHIVITTHETRESNMQSALEKLATLQSVIETPQRIRMENL